MADDFAIDVKGMTKRFGERTVVNNIDLQVAREKSMAFSVPTAAAKRPSSACSAACSTPTREAAPASAMM